MITIRYPSGREHDATVTVGELIAELQRYPAELAILPMWEGIFTYIQPGGIRVGNAYGTQALIINVDKWQ